MQSDIGYGILEFLLRLLSDGLKRKEMIKIKTLEVAGIASAVQALRLPFKKECRSLCTTTMRFNDDKVVDEPYFEGMSIVDFEPKDLRLMSTLVKRGDEHAKVMRGIVVYAEIEAPIWFYRELETYRIGRERLSCESTMHCECKGLSGEELEEAKDKIPMGHIQKTVDMYSYQALRRLYAQRDKHRLPMWKEFRKWIETLPFAKELIIVGFEDDKV